MNQRENYDNSPGSFRKSMEEFGNVYETVFQTAMKLCIEFNMQDESETAAKKILSYNPSNQELNEAFPQYKKVADFLSHLIRDKLNSLSLRNNDNDSTKNANKTHEEKDDDEKAKNLNPLIQNLNKKFNENIEISHLKKYKEIDTNSIPWDIMGNCYLLLGDFPNAFSAFSQFFQIKFQADFDFDSANLERYIFDDPPNVKNIFFWFSFGVINAHYKYHKNAISCFQKIMHFLSNPMHLKEISAKNGQITKEFLFDIKNEITFRMAISYQFLEQYEDSLKHFQSIVSTPPVMLKMDDVLFQVAYTFQVMKEFDKAESIYRDVYDRHPQNFQITLQYGWFFISWYMYQNDDDLSLYNQGLRLLLDAFNLSHSDPLISFLLGKVMMLKEQYQKAYNYYKNCINYWTDSSSFWCDLGILYYKNNQMPDALIAFQRALYISPENEDAWINMGTVFEKMSQFQNAKEIYFSGKNFCKDKIKLDEIHRRINLLEKFGAGNNQGVLVNNDVIYVINDKNFEQVPLEFSNNFLVAVPRILPDFIGFSSQIDVDIGILSSYPKSLF